MCKIFLIPGLNCLIPFLVGGLGVYVASTILAKVFPNWYKQADQNHINLIATASGIVFMLAESSLTYYFCG